MFSGVLTFLGRPGGFLFSADPIVLTLWTHSKIVFRSGTLSLARKPNRVLNALCVAVTDPLCSQELLTTRPQKRSWNLLIVVFYNDATLSPYVGSLLKAKMLFRSCPCLLILTNSIIGVCALTKQTSLFLITVFLDPSFQLQNLLSWNYRGNRETQSQSAHTETVFLV
jgi:hypothetical protein